MFPRKLSSTVFEEFVHEDPLNWPQKIRKSSVFKITLYIAHVEFNRRTAFF